MCVVPQQFTLSRSLRCHRSADSVIRCDIWLARLSQLRSKHRALLSKSERERMATYRKRESADQFALGAAMVRLICSVERGQSAASMLVDRLCLRCGRDHAPPKVNGGPHLSVSHSGDVVAVGACREAEIGIDIERVQDLDVESIAAAACASTELKYVTSAAELLTTWVRKESILKATGDGLDVSPRGVRVTPPHEPPLLISYAGRPGLVVRMQDLPMMEGFVGSLAALSPTLPVLVRRDSQALLAVAV